METEFAEYKGLGKGREGQKLKLEAQPTAYLVWRQRSTLSSSC